MKKPNRFWIDFQSYLNNAVPDFIVKTLILAGFDNAMSLSELEDSDIIAIEKFASEKCVHLIELDSENGEFKFKPGHRKLLFNISKKANNFLEEKASKKKQSQSQARGEVEEIEILSSDEITKLRENLINRINATCKLHGLDILFTEQEISAIEPYISYSRSALNKPSYKCLVKCVVCDKSVPCTHNGHWQTSNLENHIKKEGKCREKAKTNSENTVQLQNTEAEKELNKLLDKTD